jgi:hypothetical protein
MKLFRQYFLLLIAVCLQAVCRAQETIEDKPEMATGMRSNGKIYVVVAIVLTILFILIGYLVYVDRKISRLEKENKK